jgi:CHAD domain-containing protein
MRQKRTRPALGIAHQARSLSPAGISRGTPACLADSLAHRWKCYCKYLRRCQKKSSERTVHDLRVEARRLLALLGLCSPFLAANRLAKIQAELKCHLDVFDELRDTQVQRALVRNLRSRYVAATDFYRYLKKCESRLGHRTRKRTRKLAEKPLARLMGLCREAVQSWARQRGTRAAEVAVLRNVRGAFREASRFHHKIDSRDPHSIHCTRIAFKKFRYMVEALAEQLPWADARLLEKMRRYQAMMGDVQDAQVLWRAFEKFARKETIDPDSRVRFARALERGRNQRIKLFLRAAGQLPEFEPPQGPSPQAGSSGRRPRPKSRRLSKTGTGTPKKTQS